MKRALIWLILLLFVLAACAPASTPDAPTAQAAPTQPPADANPDAYPYPAPDTAAAPDMIPNYPAPEDQPTAQPVSLPTDLTPKEGLCTVKGKLVTTDGKPYIIDLYLANFLKGSDETAPEMLTFSENTSPHAIQDPATGEFVFIDVQPGRYGVGVSSPAGSLIIAGKDGEFLSFEVQSGEIHDLGEVLAP